MKAKFIYEAFEKKSKDKNIKDLTLPSYRELSEKIKYINVKEVVHVKDFLPDSPWSNISIRLNNAHVLAIGITKNNEKEDISQEEQNEVFTLTKDFFDEFEDSFTQRISNSKMLDKLVGMIFFIYRLDSGIWHHDFTGPKIELYSEEPKW